MLKVRLLASALLVALAGFAVAQEPAAQSYEDFVAKLKSGDTAIDFQAFRFAYAETPDFDPNMRPAVEKRDLIRAVNSGDLDQALSLANRVLEANYTDMDGHYASYIIFEKSGQHAKADIHRAIVEGLMRSFTASGDGSSEDSALTAVAVAEEYAYLGLRGYQVLRQGLAPTRLGPMDIFAVTTPDNQGTTIYFNARRILAKLKRDPADGAAPVP